MTRFGGQPQVRRASEATMSASRSVQFVAACVLASALEARPSNGERAPSRRATRALIFKLWLFFAGAAGLLGACSRFSDTLLGMTIERTDGAAAALEPQVDRIFSKWTTSTPGCAVGVAVDGKPALAKAYGMADLEHDVKNTADTIFEAGSVSKQFTAAAVLLLVREAKLSLDDPVRKYIPELPSFPAPEGILAGSAGSGSANRAVPLTIRHLLHHTSGLRDWGNIAGIAGWPRTTRVHTHAHVLDIVSRQRSLNFTPGTHWSYSNTGFNLAAIIVSRVSGMPFADFTRTRIFEPLGMSHTSWRDDHTRIVRNRAIAYDDRRDGFHIDMPFENVHGNGGLLTTVGDLLKWNENFTTPTVGDVSFVAEQQRVGTFSDGRSLDYAFGLYNRPYKGVRQVDHSGSTAGYRAHLARYPDQHLSAAVLCNVSSGGATEALHAVADLYLGDPARPTIDQLRELAGTYVSDEAETALTVAQSGESLVIRRRPDTTLKLTPVYADAFDVPQLGLVIFHRDGGRVSGLSVSQDRVWDLRFARQNQAGKSTSQE